MQNVSTSFPHASTWVASSGDVTTFVGITANDFAEFIEWQGAALRPEAAVGAFEEVNRFQRVSALEAFAAMLMDYLDREGFSSRYDALVAAASAVLARHISLVLGHGRGNCTAQIEEAFQQAQREFATRRGITFLQDPRPLTLTPAELRSTLIRTLTRTVA